MGSLWYIWKMKIDLSMITKTKTYNMRVV
jgi:hypothetical protein